MKVGDEVICINSNNNAFIRVGCQYTITEIRNPGHIVIINENGKAWEYSADRFELKGAKKVAEKIDYMKAVKEICGSY
jgi:alanine dehydrogenase